MNLNNRVKKFAAFIVVGGLMGLGISYLYGQVGASCSIMCNPVYALAFGGAVGALMAFDK